MNRWRYLVPVLVVAVLIGLLAFGLTREPGRLPSVFIGQPAPAFALPRVGAPDRLLTDQDIAGKVALLNVWASWCFACRAEHELIAELAERADVPVYGLNYKDRRADALQWLTRYGNPFVASAYDAEGEVGIDYGVSGVPETFVIDRRGIIRYKQVGPVDRQALERTLLPLLRELKREGSA